MPSPEWVPWSHLWDGTEQELALEEAGRVQREWSYSSAADRRGGCAAASLLVSHVACANAPVCTSAPGAAGQTQQVFSGPSTGP